MDPFQKEVIERLTRIEERSEAVADLNRRVTRLEGAENRRNAILGIVTVTIPAAIAGIVTYLTKGTPA